MEPALLFLGALALAALAAGLGWFAGRTAGLACARTEAATERAALELEGATVRERLRSAEAQLAQVQADAAQARRDGERQRDLLDEARDELARLQERAARVPALEAQVADLQRRIDALREERTTQREELARLTTDLARQRTAFDEQIKLLQDARTALGEQFRNLANDILEEKSRRFTEQNQTQLGTLLEPLRDRLAAFQGKVEEVYVQEGKDRSALQEQVRQLAALNQALGEDARQLTQALKGSAKTQGNWGEWILERVLEASGMRKGHEYQVQDTRTREDGTRALPDVVIHLPEGRCLVVDAKVSLVAYERFASAQQEDDRAAALRAHLDSLRAHLRGLSEKRYQDLPGVRSLDFVLAFVPVEPAFIAAVTHDGSIFDEAWQRNVLLVSPSTLMFVVRTVAHLWRQEAQTRNAQEIAKRGAELYDKLCSFVGDLQQVGDRLRQAREAYEQAESRLHLGKGNAIRQAEMLRELGVKAAKRLPEALVAAALDDERSDPGTQGAANSAAIPTAIPAARPEAMPEAVPTAIPEAIPASTAVHTLAGMPASTVVSTPAAILPPVTPPDTATASPAPIVFAGTA
jgi:DNA recombination protein RmuC